MAEKITMGTEGVLHVPDDPIIPFIEGDGTGVDIWPAARLVLDTAAAKYGHTIEWKEVLAGEKAYNETGDWLPQETVEIFSEYLIGIKGPLTTPIGGGFRSLNVALRQILDLYVCLRPVRWFKGVPSPVKRPDLVDMVIFRENTEGFYADRNMVVGSGEFKPDADSAFAIRKITRAGSRRIAKAAFDQAMRRRRHVTAVHKGNVLKVTDGLFMEAVNEVAADYPDVVEHTSTHRRISRQVHDYQTAYEENGRIIDVDAFLDFLGNWLKGHIAMTDTDYIPYVKKMDG